MKHNLTATNNRNIGYDVNLDLYSTHRDSIKSFITTLDNKIRNNIIECLEPAAGNGNISNYLNSIGIKTYTSDIVERNQKLDLIIDFFDIQNTKFSFSTNVNTIITNPPYKYAEDFVRHALSINNIQYVIMYMKLTFLEGKKRYNLFQEYPPSQVYIHTSRQACDPNGALDFQNGTSAVCYAWYVWNKEDKSKNTLVKWIAPN